MAKKQTKAATPVVKKAVEQTEPVEEVEQEQMIRAAKRIDSVNTYRTMVEMSPTICTECGFDVISPNPGEKKPEWDELSTAEQAVTLKALREHRIKAHNGIVRESALVPKDQVSGSWLKTPLPI